MIITAGRPGEQPCWSQPRTGFSARTSSNEYELAAKKPRSGPVAEFRNPKPRFDVEDLAWLLRRYRPDPRDLTDLLGGALVVDFGEIGGDEAAVVRFTLCG